MDIDRLRYFSTLAQVGSFRGAAEILKISQPALSKAMKILQDEVGLRLYNYDGRGVVITKEGHEFAKKVQGILELVKNLRQSSKTSAEKVFRLGTFEVFSTHFLGNLLEVFPVPTSFELHEFLPGRIEEAVANRIVDMGITYLPVPHPTIEFISVGNIRMGIYGQAKVFEDCPFKELPFVVPILPPSGTPTKALGLDGWPDHLLPRHIRYRVGMMESALELCRQGAAVAYLPKQVVDAANAKASVRFQLQELACPIKAKEREQDVFIVKCKSEAENRQYQKVATALRRFLRG